MPPGAAAAEGRGPARRLGLARLVPLPQGEVPRVALAPGVGVRGGLHVLDPLVGQRAVVGVAADVEVDVAAAVGGGVGVTLVDQRLHDLEHLGDVTGGPRLVGGRQHPEGVERRGGRALVGVAPGPPRLAGGGGLGQDLVVDVGDVAHEGDLEAVAAGQPAAQDVEGDREPDVADVRGALGGEPADVDARPAGFDRLERAQGARGGVMKAKAHPVKVTGASPSSEPRRRRSPSPVTACPDPLRAPHRRNRGAVGAGSRASGTKWVWTGRRGSGQDGSVAAVDPLLQVRRLGADRGVVAVAGVHRPSPAAASSSRSRIDSTIVGKSLYDRPGRARAAVEQRVAAEDDAERRRVEAARRRGSGPGCAAPRSSVPPTVNDVAVGELAVGARSRVDHVPQHPVGRVQQRSARRSRRRARPPR